MLAKGCEHLMMNSACDEAVAVVLRLSPAIILIKLASRLGDVALYGVPAHTSISIIKMQEHAMAVTHVDNEAAWQSPIQMSRTLLQAA